MTPRTLYAIAGGVLAVDQLSKLIVTSWIPFGQSWAIGGAYLSFTPRHNLGAAFGLAASAAVGLIILAVLMITLILLAGPRLARANRVVGLGLSLALGGALGNLIDRLRVGYVIDFVDVHFWPVFNVADIAITCGALIVLVALFCERRAAEKAQSA